VVKFSAYQRDLQSSLRVIALKDSKTLL